MFLLSFNFGLSTVSVIIAIATVLQLTLAKGDLFRVFSWHCDLGNISIGFCTNDYYGYSLTAIAAILVLYCWCLWIWLPGGVVSLSEHGCGHGVVGLSSS